MTIPKPNGTYGWLASPVSKEGYIRHPEIGWLPHPSFYQDSGISNKLCKTLDICKKGNHTMDCKETRLRMAAYYYIRAEKNGQALSYRELEMLWGVSRSTIQRRKRELMGKSNINFLINAQKAPASKTSSNNPC